MSTGGATSDDVPQDDSERDALLNALVSKWRRFTWRELYGFENSDELVAQIVARYGVKQDVARRDVDILLNGRTLNIR